VRSFTQKRVLQPIVGLGLLLGAYAPPVPTTMGSGPAFHPPPLSAAAGRCSRAAHGHWSAAHLELFAHGRVVLVPAHIGVARRCPVRTTAPTGVVEFATSARLSLADLFAVWGQPLSSSRLAGFHGRVSAYVSGRPWRGDVRKIPLLQHGQITLEVGGFVQPHAFFLFPTAGA
jgi:hypothetical protein